MSFSLSVMNDTIRKKLYRSLAAGLVAVLLLLTSEFEIPVVDEATDRYFSQAIIEAGAAYTSCRLLNGAVSVIKGSSLQLEPAGVGVSLAAGQVLDPIDDLTERLSLILVTAITSLGTQKLAYEISVALGAAVLSALLLIFSVLIWLPDRWGGDISFYLLRLSLLVLAARLCLPISALVNTSVHEHFFAEKISAAVNELSASSTELQKLRTVSFPQTDGVLETIESGTVLLRQKSTQFKEAMAAMADNMTTIVGSLLKLAYLYIGIFLFQVIFLPLLTFYLLVKTTGLLFRPAGTVHDFNQ